MYSPWAGMPIACSLYSPYRSRVMRHKPAISQRQIYAWNRFNNMTRATDPFDTYLLLVFSMLMAEGSV